MTNKETTDRLKAALLEFVERAVKPKATAEEVEALPAVAQALINAIRN